MCGFSIIIPIYNTHIEYLTECLQSIINQTHDNWECILVDDCSTESQTLTFINNLITRNTKFRLTKTKKKSGPGPARNAGLLIASKELIIYLDSDDYLELNALETINKYFQQIPDLDILSFNDFILENSVKKMVTPIYDGFEPYKILNSQNENIIKDKPTVWSKCFSKKFIDKWKLAFLENCWFSEDIYYQIVSYSRANKILFIDEPLVTYRVGHKSMSTTWFLENKVKETFNHLVAAYETIKFDINNRVARYYRYFFEFLFEKRIVDGVPDFNLSDQQKKWWFDIIQKANEFVNSLPE